jgi:hypothetical protein
MAHFSQPQHSGDRRDFLWRAAAAATMAFGRSGSAAEQKPDPASLPPMPSIALGPHRISRLVAGWNPVGGHAHSTFDMHRSMLEYFTLENTVEFLARCERNGITAWQFDYCDKSVDAIRKRREQGAKIKLICLHAERSSDVPIKKVVADTAPIAMVHHGGVTDALFRAGKHSQVHDFVKKVHDQGLLAGVSSHCPDNIQRIADEGWENDLFMTCFYYVTRPVDEQKKLLGKSTVGEPFFESDPVDMTRVVRQVKQPCLGFKILAAGRVCTSRPSINRAFKFAFQNIKPIDGVIVGMYPRYSDEVGEDAECAREFGR